MNLDNVFTTENLAIAGLLVLAGISLFKGQTDIALPIATAIAGYISNPQINNNT